MKIYAPSNPLTFWTGVLTLGLTLGLGIQFVTAWQAPTAAAPGGNVAGPITTGGDQTKNGSLSLTQNKYYKVGNAFLSSGGQYSHLALNEWYNGSAWVASGNGSLVELGDQWVAFYKHTGGSHTVLGSFSSGAFNYGGIRIGDYHTLNGHSNSWLYLGDQNGNVFGGRGLAAGNLYAGSRSYANEFCFLSGVCISGSWPNTSTLQARVTGECGTNESIKKINADGTVVCETDDAGGVATYNQLPTGSVAGYCVQHTGVWKIAWGAIAPGIVVTVSYFNKYCSCQSGWTILTTGVQRNFDQGGNNQDYDISWHVCIKN